MIGPMVFGLLATHLFGIGAASFVGRRSMRAALIVASIAPAATALWTMGQLVSGIGVLVFFLLSGLLRA